MRLSELLTELRENILHDRSNRVEGATDQLWSDQTLVRYINEAQLRFARLGLVIRDSATASVTQVQLVAGQQDYPLNSAVLGVVSARLDGDPTDLLRVGHAYVGGYLLPGNPAGVTTAEQFPPGKVLAYSTDDGIVQGEDDTVSAAVLRVYPTPTADNLGLIRLRTIRKPLETLSTVNMRAVPEIPSDHHLEMLDWAAYLALRIVDLDAGMERRAAEFRGSFELAVTRARSDVMRKLHVPTRFAFGRNGFSWEK